ncbi:glycosyltransferase family 4 protein [Aquicoccus sp. G2-2]|uniref:glycosyltransferase family 4 protein n=1 Tax=Aquicoccus sp. G2-2 TaxID=3092120 RepID=UPI002AE06351|nr:glycosyltransferase family 1 protein [Aquicoccus sp. G2-2]MEA1114648.1 glycosyltransferase family 1 protein [Aquicoccus sp. G2-2]
MSEDSVSARLLDLTRLISRAGRTLTGIDRVELAYLKALVEQPAPAFGLIKSNLGYLLLDAAGMRALAARIEGDVAWGKADRLSRAFSKLDKMQRRAQSDARRLAIARSFRGGLKRLLRLHLPKGCAYINVGHSNFTDRVADAVKQGAQGKIAVMVHDTIPLDHPLYQTPEAVVRFEHMLGRVREKADLVIYNSAATRRAAEGYMADWGGAPRGVVAHLGVEVATPEPGALPKGVPPDGVYFVSVGTLEPRKNHMLLIEIWERLVKQTPPQEVPHLVICGHRGWKNEELFFRLDRSQLMGAYIHELPGLSDGAVAALLHGAAGALYPSFAEGYGLPMIEAAASGVPVLCADLPVYREVLGDYPVYASLKDSYLWQRRITALAKSKTTDRRAGKQVSGDGAQGFTPPAWQAHFKTVLKLT